MSTVPEEATASTTLGSSRMPRCPAHGNRSTSGGTSARMRISLGTSPRMSSPSCPGPSRTSMACSRLPSVADRPQVFSPGASRLSRARQSWSWTPRLLPSSSCHSSTTTERTPASSRCASAWDSMTERLSGVVTRAAGGRARWRPRAAWPVSPVRISTRQGTPRDPAADARPSVVSLARARSGVIHRHLSPPASPDPASSSGPTQAASVLPLPVGEWMSPERPSR